MDGTGWTAKDGTGHKETGPDWGGGGQEDGTEKYRTRLPLFPTFWTDVFLTAFLAGLVVAPEFRISSCGLRSSGSGGGGGGIMSASLLASSSGTGERSPRRHLPSRLKEALQRDRACDWTPLAREAS